MPTVYDPIWIGNVKLKNRFVVAPTTKNFCSERGFVTDRFLQNWEVEAQGPGLVTVEFSYVQPNGRVFTRQLGVYADECICGLTDLTERIHEAGAKAALQLTHGGNLCTESLIGETPVSASERPQWPGQKVRALTTGEVEGIIESYGEGARRAQTAGFDAVDLHGCHGSMILQFLSPFHNRDRTDKYAARTTFLYEVVQAVQEACGKDFPIIARLSTHEFMQEDKGEPGLTIDEVAGEICPHLESLGVACIHASAGRIGHTPDHAFPPLYAPRGVNVKLATRVKENVSIPVIAVGRLQDPKLIEKIIEDGKADMVAMSRPIIADPHLPKKMIEGRFDDIRQCMGCNWCLHRLFVQVSVQCPMNPEYGHEIEYAPKPAARPRKVMVVGGGPAGLQTALTAAQCGHEVSLYERTDHLGGQVRLASSMPKVFTKELWNTPKWLKRQVEKQGVVVNLGTEVKPDLIEEVDPAVVVIATGAKEVQVDLPGADKVQVVYLWEYLNKRTEIGNRVLVLGGHEGAEVALSIARGGKEVILVEATDSIAAPAYIYDYAARRDPLCRELAKANVRIMTCTEVKGVSDEGRCVLSEGPLQTEEIVKVDTIIVAAGREPDDEFFLSLQGTAREIHRVGDCVAPASMVAATHGGHWIARHI